MNKQEIGRAPQEMVERWIVCLLEAQSLSMEVCVSLARRRQRRGDRNGGSVEVVAASEIYDIAFGDVPIPRDAEDEIQPVLERLKAADLAIKLMCDE